MQIKKQVRNNCSSNDLLGVRKFPRKRIIRFSNAAPIDTHQQAEYVYSIIQEHFSFFYHMHQCMAIQKTCLSGGHAPEHQYLCKQPLLLLGDRE